MKFKNTETIDKIRKKDLNRGLPPIIIDENGFCNTVLALYKREYLNNIISCWQTSNTQYYCNNSEKFKGWIGLEEID